MEAYDPHTAQLIAFGGLNSSSNLGDTWEWNGVTWTQLSPATSPAARNYGALAYDAATQQLILFGGVQAASSGRPALGDTWAWTGSTWTELATSGPTNRASSMGYDAATGQMLLFGGASDGNGNSGATYYNDTWDWTGSAWVQLAPTTVPPASTGGALGYDTSTSQMIMTGGYSYSAGSFTNTWSWNGSNWVLLSPPHTSPGASALIYDPQMSALVSYTGDTWIWTGSDWDEISTSGTSLSSESTDYDSATSQLVSFGGYNSGYSNATWIVGAPCVTAASPLSGTPSGGTSVVITGSNFAGASSVHFGSTAAASFALDSATEITAVSPAGTGIENVTVTTPIGTSTVSSPDQFTFLAPPTVASVSPSQGTTQGGTMVTIKGTNFATPTSVYFGSAAASSVTLVSSTEITVVSPAAASGIINITVRTAGGTSATSSADQFSYVINPPGYWMTTSHGNVYSFGVDGYHGSLNSSDLTQPIVGITATPDGGGYWLVSSGGGIFSFGDARYYGSMGGKTLAAPIVGLVATANGDGYWLVASDGGIFAFGDAGFYGSMGGRHLNKPIVGMASTPNGKGYWLVASDGGIFAFGDAGFYGSMGGRHLNEPIVGMASTGTGGYWLVASDGGIFSFGDAGFYGSMGGRHLNKPVVGMVATSDGKGYWLAAGDGGIFSFGDAGFVGSMGASPPSWPVTAVAVSDNP